MSRAHPTVEPEQATTDSYLVFQHTRGRLSLVRRIAVPRYSQPNADGVELDEDKRLSLAVARAVESERGALAHEPYVGEEFEVLTDIGADEFETVRYEQNPAFDGVWNPEEEA